MFDTEDFGWCDRSILAPEPSVDITFLTSDRYYVGDPNDPLQLSDPNCYVSLARAALTDMISVSDLRENEADLAFYYRDIIEREVSINRTFEQFSHYFWMRLQFSWTWGGFLFPWYDSWSDMEPLLTWMAVAEDGAEWFDIEQGWEMQICLRAGQFHLRQGDGEGDEQLNIKIDRDTILKSTETAKKNCVHVIGELSRYLGTDVWTRRTYRQRVVFGTDAWSPYNKT